MSWWGFTCFTLAPLCLVWCVRLITRRAATSCRCARLRLLIFACTFSLSFLASANMDFVCSIKLQLTKAQSKDSIFKRPLQCGVDMSSWPHIPLATARNVPQRATSRSHLLLFLWVFECVEKRLKCWVPPKIMFFM